MLTPISLPGQLLSVKASTPGMGSTFVPVKFAIEHWGTAWGFVETPGATSVRRVFTLPFGAYAGKGETWIWWVASVKWVTPYGG